MARIYTVLVIIGVAVAFSEGTYFNGWGTSWDDIYGWRVNDHLKIYPYFDPFSQAVGIGFSVRFRRDLASASAVEIFKMIDRSRDGLIDVCEWTTEGGSLSNFMRFLTVDDTDGDERISFDEYPKVAFYDEDQKEDSQEVRPTAKA